MKTAIVVLEEALNVCVTNEPINRKEGNEEQAYSESVSAASIRQALAILNAASNGHIWPEPEPDFGKSKCVECPEQAVNCGKCECPPVSP